MKKWFFAFCTPVYLWCVCEIAHKLWLGRPLDYMEAMIVTFALISSAAVTIKDAIEGFE